MSGIGPDLARKLSREGIDTYDELRDLWLARGGDHRRMLGWLTKSMPGANRLVLAKATKGMALEWGSNKEVVKDA